MSGKNKKKSKPMSLTEFHAITPSANTESTAAVPQNDRAGPINWADEMEKIADSQPPPNFIFDRSALPTATKSMLQQDVNLELVPKKPPFTAYLSNISFEADEEKIRAFFKDLKVETVRLPNDHGRPKGYGYVDFADRESLIAAIGKNEQPLNNRPLKISLENKQGNRDRPAFNSGNQHDGPQKSDEADWRRREPEAEEPEKPAFTGYQNQNQFQNQNQYQNRGGYQNQNRGGYQNRGGPGGENNQFQRREYQRNPNPWQVAGRTDNDYNRGQRDNDFNRGRDNYEDGQKRRQFNRDYQNKNPNFNPERRQNRPNDGPREGEEAGENQSAEPVKVERPKVVLAPRTVPIEEPGSNATASSIFGGAKPVDTAARERQIEERIKEKERERAVSEKSTSDTNPGENPEEEEQKTTSGTERSHKVSTTSADSHQEYRSPPNQNRGQDHSPSNLDNKPRHYNKDRGQRGGLQQSGSFTSPPHHQQNANQPRSHEKPPREYSDASRPSENAWKTKPASDLFSEQNQAGENSGEGENQGYRGQQQERRPYNPNNKRVDSAGGQSRPNMHRDKDKRPFNNDRNKQFGRNQKGDRQFQNSRGGHTEVRAPRPPQQVQQTDDINDFNVGNKFSGLQLDVEEDM